LKLLSSVNEKWKLCVIPKYIVKILYKTFTIQLRVADGQYIQCLVWPLIFIFVLCLLFSVILLTCIRRPKWCIVKLYSNELSWNFSGQLTGKLHHWCSNWKGAWYIARWKNWYEASCGMFAEQLLLLLNV